MSSFIRKLKRHKLNEQKKKIEKQAISMIQAEICTSCDRKLDRSTDDLDTWNVKVFDDHVELLCDRCNTNNDDK